MKKMKLLGIYLYRDNELFTKFCRLLRAFIKSKIGNEDELNRVSQFIGEIMLPSLTLHFGNPGLPFEIWSVLKQIKYEKR